MLGRMLLILASLTPSRSQHQPIYAKKMCTSIVKVSYHPHQPTLFASIALRFNADGTKYDAHAAIDSQAQSYYETNMYNWNAFPLVTFDNYVVNATQDPLFIYGVRQSVPKTTSTSQWLAYRGYQLPGLTFSSDGMRAHVESGADMYVDASVRAKMAHLYPPNLFGTYAGEEWVKEPYYFTSNGFRENNDGSNPLKYFRCRSY